jgi:formylglycine-generating enzyme required for sulfatase activity
VRVSLLAECRTTSRRKPHRVFSVEIVIVCYYNGANTTSASESDDVMDDASLIRILEAAVQQATINDRDRRKIQKFLPALRSGSLDPDDRLDLEEIAAEFVRQHPAPASMTIGDDNTFDAGNAVLASTAARDINQHNETVAGDKIVNQFFAGKPPADGKALLTAYLARIVENNSDLHLYRMTKRAQSGSGQDLLPPLKLADVYTNVVVDGAPVRLYARTRPAPRAYKLSKRIKQRLLNDVAPEMVRVFEGELSTKVAEDWKQRHPGEILTWDRLEDNVPVGIFMSRPPLAIESIAIHPRLALLGEPGYGKSTLLRYLALMLAQYHLNPAAPLPLGWQQADPPPVPLFCSLAVAADGLRDVKPGVESDTKVLWNALHQQIEGVTGQGVGLRDYLRGALDAGGIVLLLDGLDEISASPDADGISLRARMSAAVANLGRQLPRGLPIVVTCRVLPYTQPSDPTYPRNVWQLPRDEGWTSRTIQPFARGQVCQFVRSWYIAASHHTARYSPTERAARAERLIEDLERDRLRVLTRSPLLLTMLAILHYNRPNADLPTTEAALYEECITLLLERWEPVRTLNHPKLGLLEELGLAESGKTLDDIRSILHRIAFDAHNRPPDPSDGRGIIRDIEIVGELQKAFSTWKCEDIAGKITTFLRVLRENAALLHELDDERYAFPHLTFQEFLAACQLADTADLERAYRVWSSPDGDRWRVIMLLFAGRLRAERKVDPTGERWVRMLLRKKMPADKNGYCADKTPRQRQRDALLAYDCYAEFDRRAALLNRDSEELEDLERLLAQALVTVLGPDLVAPTADCVAAGFALGTLHDPRRGVCDLEIDWCDVPAGQYTIGSDSSDLDAFDNEKPLQTVIVPAFRMSRYVVTNAQWKMFMDADGYANKQWWNYGWDVSCERQWKEPRYWHDWRFSLPNQPVVGISWYEAQAFCAWLSIVLGYKVTLPTEAEWEVSARGSQRLMYAWGNEWHPDLTNTRENPLDRTTVVGCYPHGASWCGALDITGNVWEWTNSDFWKDDRSSHISIRRDDRSSQISIVNNTSYISIRGGAWDYGRRNVRCAGRGRNNPQGRFYDLSLRLVTAAVEAYLNEC